MQKHYKVIGIDLAKTKFHLAAMDVNQKILLKKAISRKDFFAKVNDLFPGKNTFAFEACGGSHYTAQRLQELGHEVILLKPKDVKPYAKSRQKNDINDAIAICKTACDPDLMHVQPKTKKQQEISYFHKARQNAIQQRIQVSNSLMTSLQEFGYVVECGKSTFGKLCKGHVEQALEMGFITKVIHEEMQTDCEEIEKLFAKEKKLEKEIIRENKRSEAAQLLETIPGIGPINASLLSNKPMALYEKPKDFSASLGLVPKQYSTGGKVQLGSITKQGDRYARTMLIQGARAIIMRTFKPNVPRGALYAFAQKLLKRGKRFNVVCVAVANKLARVAYACITKNAAYTD
jgi:transposase